MLYWIYEYWQQAFKAGAPWADNLSFLRLLGYVTVRSGMACMITFVLSVVFGPWVIRKLVSLKVGQPIRSAEEVHKLNDEELEIEVHRLRRRLYELRCQSVTEKIEDTSQYASTRRDIARLLTEQRQRQLAQAAS